MRVLARVGRACLPTAIALALAVGVAVGGYFGYGFITTSDRFAVQVIDVRGNDAVSAERISTILDVTLGDNVFSLDLDRLAERLEREPMIARATVSRRLPDTLLVNIGEKQPVALVELGELYLADASGEPFKRADIALGDGDGLPVITGLSRAQYIDRPEFVHAQIRHALDAVAMYRASDEGERPRLGEVHLHPRHGITFTTYERAVAVRVGHGDPDAIRDSLRAFDIAWRALEPTERQRARIVYADVSNRPDRVTVGFEHLE